MSRASGSQRLVRIASRAAVVTWMAGAAAWSALGGGAPIPPGLASLEAIPIPAPPPPVEETPAPVEPQPPTARADAPRPAEAEPPEAEVTPEVTRVGADEIAEGGRLLSAGGGFPALTSSYAGFGSFGEYARAMVELGARFVIVRERRILAEIDFETGALAAFDGAAEFSPRARDYAGEPALRALARTARAHHGAAAEVMLLVPRALDAGLFGGIARVLRDRGETHARYREIRGSYQPTPGGDVVLRIDSGVRRDGTSVPLDLVFDLTEIARS